MKIGYVSFRLAGFDGVSLEAGRWKIILERMGHQVVNIAGELEGPGELVPELHFLNKEQAGTDQIQSRLEEVILKHRPDKLIIANMWSLPLNVNAGIALKNIVFEHQIPTVARNHDFWWERRRFCEDGKEEFWRENFPPRSKQITQVVINSIAGEELFDRTGCRAAVIGDCFDFTREYKPADYDGRWRQDLGIDKRDLVFVQATRIVPRKQIELAIELAEKLCNPKVVLVIAGEGGDEGDGYVQKIRQRGAGSSARVILAREILGNKYSLWDYLAYGDFMTLPSAQEGFGNQLLEGIYFKKPIFLNKYEVYKRDLEPLGFETAENPQEVIELMGNRNKIKQVTEKNFQIARENFSFEATENKIRELLKF